MNPYRKLTRKKRSLTGYTQAWIADDHLLIVDSTRFVERYRRFAFADIQAIVVADRPSLWLVQGIAVLISLSWMLWSLEAQSLFAKWFFAVTGLIAVGFAVADILRGGRCRCVVQTAVSREVLRPVSRIPVARKFLAAIGPRIEAAQAGLAPLSPAEAAMEESSAGSQEVLAAPQQAAAEEPAAAAGPPAIPDLPPEALEEQAALAQTAELPSVVRGAASDAPQPPALVRRPGYLVEVFFGLLVLDAVLIAMALRTAENLAIGVLMTIYTAEVVVAIAAVVQSRARSSLCLGLAIAALAGALMDVAVFSGPAVFGNFFAMIVATARTGAPPAYEPGSLQTPLQTILISAGWRACVGVLGLGACFAERRTEPA